MKNKKFDCVEMKRRGAKIIQDKIKDMNQKKELEFWKNRSQALKNHQKEIIKKRDFHSPTHLDKR